jgi:hypothetical protein
VCFRNGALVKTSDRSYCIVGEWTNYQKLIEARPKMIRILERSATKDIGTGLRVTDPMQTSKLDAGIRHHRHRNAGRV